MRISYHPAVQDDVNEILDHYREAGGEALADRFFQEFNTSLQAAALQSVMPTIWAKLPFDAPSWAAFHT